MSPYPDDVSGVSVDAGVGGGFGVGVFVGSAAAADTGVRVGYEASSDIDETSSVSACLLYTSPSPRDATLSRMPSSA